MTRVFVCFLRFRATFFHRLFAQVLEEDCQDGNSDRLTLSAARMYFPPKTVLPIDTKVFQ